MNDDFLTQLAEVDAPTRMPGLESIERRAQAIRRARHGRRWGLITAGVAVLAVGGVTIPTGSDGPGDGPASAGMAVYLGVIPASASDTGAPVDCRTGFGSWIAREDWSSYPDVEASAALLTDAPFPLTGVGVHQDANACPPAAPAAVLIDDDPVRGVSVWPDVENPYQGQDGLEERAVRGTTGQLLAHSQDSLTISWAAPDGSGWLAEGSGMTADEFVATLDALVFTDRQLDPATVPADYAIVALTAPSLDPVAREWWINYGDESQLESVERPAFMHLSATGTYRFPVEVYASRYAQGVQLTEVAGKRAVFLTSAPGATTGTLMWQDDGVSYGLLGATGMADLTRLAEGLEHVELTDPRLAEAPSYPPAD